MFLRDLSADPVCPTAAPRGEIVHRVRYSRHDLRIARILALGDLLGQSISVSYLDSCDVRALPAILARLEREYQRRARRPTIGGVLPWGQRRAKRRQARA